MDFQNNINQIKQNIWMPIISFLLVFFAYNGSRLITKNFMHYNLDNIVDAHIPFLSWTVLIYFGCYVIWIVNYCMACLNTSIERKKFFISDAIVKIICFLIYILFPTTNTRPLIEGTGAFNNLMQFLYAVDIPNNLFPSLHCVQSWFAFLAVKNLHISKSYKIFSFIAAIAVFISTLTTKQHVIYDVIGAIVISQIVYTCLDIGLKQ